MLCELFHENNFITGEQLVISIKQLDNPQSWFGKSVASIELNEVRLCDLQTNSSQYTQENSLESCKNFSFFSQLLPGHTLLLYFYGSSTCNVNAGHCVLGFHGWVSEDRRRDSRSHLFSVNDAYVGLYLCQNSTEAIQMFACCVFILYRK